MKSTLFIPTMVMAFLAITLLLIGYFKGGGEHISGTKAGIKMIVEILPLLFFAFILAGMVQVLLPHEVIARWVGTESGLRGIIVGTLAGSITPGGPYVSMPLAAGLLRAGAGMGTMVAFLTAWSIWAVARLPIEIGVMGWRFTAVRLACSFFFPPLAGFLANFFFSGVKP